MIKSGMRYNGINDADFIPAKYDNHTQRGEIIQHDRAMTTRLYFLSRRSFVSVLLTPISFKNSNIDILTYKIRF
ncbi:MAG TPA: hypothetical protein VEB40_13705 [Flavipsychrobacter sp.]|nr:hypothetical protein [Flavipsychrobacter sp.]